MLPFPEFATFDPEFATLDPEFATFEEISNSFSMTYSS